MARRDAIILFLGIFGGLLLTFLVYTIALQRSPAVPRPTVKTEQQELAKIYQIRFDQQYDIFCSFRGNVPTTYRDCKILGFTSRVAEFARSGRASSSGGFSFSSDSASYHDDHFDHWLVLELADGRLAYIPPRAVEYIEQASPTGQ